jgi:hypothetical protein
VASNLTHNGTGALRALAEWREKAANEGPPASSRVQDSHGPVRGTTGCDVHRTKSDLRRARMKQVRTNKQQPRGVPGPDVSRDGTDKRIYIVNCICGLERASHGDSAGTQLNLQTLP